MGFRLPGDSYSSVKVSYDWVVAKHDDVEWNDHCVYKETNIPLGKISSKLFQKKILFLLFKEFKTRRIFFQNPFLVKTMHDLTEFTMVNVLWIILGVFNSVKLIKFMFIQ